MAIYFQNKFFKSLQSVRNNLLKILFCTIFFNFESTERLSQQEKRKKEFENSSLGWSSCRYQVQSEK